MGAKAPERTCLEWPRCDPPMPSSDRPAPPIRLAFGRAFWRMMLIAWLFVYLGVATAILRRAPPQAWVGAFIWFIPSTLMAAFVFSAAATVAAALVVRLFVAPRLRAWQSPRLDEWDADAVSAFHLESREHEVASSPCRLLDGGRKGRTGRMVVTNRRLLFLPKDWDVEPWSIRLDRVDHVEAVQGRQLLWGFVHGVPPELVVFVGHDEPRRFAIASADDWMRLIAPHVGGIVFKS